MICRRVSDVIIRFASNSDDVRLADFKHVRGLDREWKARTFSLWRSMTSNESYIFLAVFAALALVALIYLLSPMSLPDEPLLYLIGVNHAVQFKSALAQMFGESESVRNKREAFKAHVAETIDKLGIEILAEEFNQEAKRQPDARQEEASREKAAAELGTAPKPLNWETVLEQFSKAEGIKHRFCDPDTKEREALGLEVDPRKETESDRRK